MDKKILMVIAQHRFRDEEFEHPKTVFTQKGFSITVAAPESKEATGVKGAKVMPDLSIADAATQQFDAIVVVGGGGARDNLWKNRTLYNILNAHHAAGKPVAAICIAPVVLARAGLLKGISATVFKEPETLAEFVKHGVNLEEKDVVVSGHIVTANGPAAARAFGIAVAELLA